MIQASRCKNAPSDLERPMLHRFKHHLLTELDFSATETTKCDHRFVADLGTQPLNPSC